MKQCQHDALNIPKATVSMTSIARSPWNVPARASSCWAWRYHASSPPSWERQTYRYQVRAGPGCRGGRHSCSRRGSPQSPSGGSRGRTLGTTRLSPRIRPRGTNQPNKNEQHSFGVDHSRVWICIRYNAHFALNLTSGIRLYTGGLDSKHVRLMYV